MQEEEARILHLTVHVAITRMHEPLIPDTWYVLQHQYLPCDVSGRSRFFYDIIRVFLTDTTVLFRLCTAILARESRPNISPRGHKTKQIITICVLCLRGMHRRCGIQNIVPCQTGKQEGEAYTFVATTRHAPEVSKAAVV